MNIAKLPLITGLLYCNGFKRKSMKHRHNILILLTAFAFACSAESETNNLSEELQPVPENTNSSSVERLVEPEIEINAHLQTILDKSDTTYELPMNVDTSFIKAIDFTGKRDQSSLSYENGLYLAEHLLESAPTDNGTYYLNTFYQLDSLKSVGEYDEYVNNLDIGMMQVADAFVEGIIDLGDQRHIVLWSINFSTYEACPFASGAAVYGSLLSNYEVQNTMLLAEVSGGGDPPAWGDTNISTQISTTLEIDTYYINRSGEDEESIDIIEETYLTKIIELGFRNAAE